MSDNNPNPPSGENQEKNDPPSGENENKPEYITRDELEKQERTNAWIQGKIRDIDKTLEKVNESLAGFGKKDADDKGDDGKKDAALEEIEKLRKQLDDAQKVQEATRLKGLFIEEYGSDFNENLASAWWDLNGQNYKQQVDKKTGKPVLVQKDAEFRTIADDLRDLETNQPSWFANKANGGAGAPSGGGGSGDVDSRFPSNWEQMSKEKRKAWFDQQRRDGKPVRL